VDLDDYLDRVQDRASFLDFVRTLIDDREEEVAQEREKPSNLYGPWENGTIEDFLFAALRWAEDSEGQEEGLPEQLSWKAFATFLYCGKVYESRPTSVDTKNDQSRNIRWALGVSRLVVLGEGRWANRARAKRRIVR
jgi:hypothetical protein